LGATVGHLCNNNVPFGDQRLQTEAPVRERRSPLSSSYGLSVIAATPLESDTAPPQITFRWRKLSDAYVSKGRGAGPAHTDHGSQTDWLSWVTPLPAPPVTPVPTSHVMPLPTAQPVPLTLSAGH
jgi:hypothetical protein